MSRLLEFKPKSHPFPPYEEMSQEADIVDEEFAQVRKFLAMTKAQREMALKLESNPRRAVLRMLIGLGRIYNSLPS